MDFGIKKLTIRFVLVTIKAVIVGIIIIYVDYRENDKDIYATNKVVVKKIYSVLVNNIVNKVNKHIEVINFGHFVMNDSVYFIDLKIVEIELIIKEHY